MNAIETVVQRAHRNEKAAKTFITICGIGMALVPLLIGAFLFVKGTDTFFTFGHSVTEFLFSGQWKPSDTAEGGGQIGAAMFLAGSLVTCLLALLISLPFSLASSIYMTEIATPQRRRLIQPAIELFTGIPSVVYGFVGMTVLIPALRHIFPMPFGFSVLAAGIVLAVMISRRLRRCLPTRWRLFPNRGAKLLTASARLAGKRLLTSYFLRLRAVFSPALSWAWPVPWAKPWLLLWLSVR